MKRILINATQAEELRVAMVDGQVLYDLDIEVPSREQKKSNIYKGVITRIEPSLEAAFVNYGADRHGFLPFKEISRMYFSEDAKDDNGRFIVKDAIKVDQQLIVQVEKEERGNKGAALTTFISLAGRFLVAMPQNPRAGGVSRRIEGEDREQVRQVMSELDLPKNMGVIARTAGVGRSVEEMQWDLDYLVQLWSAIEQAAEERKAPFLIYQESDIVIRALRDHYKTDVGEVLIDSQSAFERAQEFMSMVMPKAANKLKHYQDKQPLFNRFQIENQIESAFNRTVNLPSGGAIVIDHTEALTSIDINSARATKGGDIEETALNTNLEAADEIARQLRIRDLGGLIVIDFIDMMKNKNQRDVEQRLRRAVYEDRARVQIGRISRFGLLEMSRQRLRPSLGESSQIVCPRCCGQGTIRDVESLSLSVLRLLEEEAMKDNTGRILAKLPVECATYLLNEKRSKIAGIEDRNKVHCVIIPDPNKETPHFNIERVRENDTHRHESSYKSSYEMASEDAPVYTPEPKAVATGPTQTAAIKLVAPQAPKPDAKPPAPVAKEAGLISKVFSALFGGSEKKEEISEEKSERKQSRPQRSPSRNRNRSAQNRNRKPKNARNQDTGKQSQTDDKKDQPQSAHQDGGDTRKKPQKSRNSRSRGPRRNPQNRQAADQKEQKGDNTEQKTNQNPETAQSKKPSRPKRATRAADSKTDVKDSRPAKQVDSDAASQENRPSQQNVKTEGGNAASGSSEQQPQVKPSSSDIKPVQRQSNQSSANHTETAANVTDNRKGENTAPQVKSDNAPANNVERSSGNIDSPPQKPAEKPIPQNSTTDATKIHESPTKVSEQKPDKAPAHTESV